VRRLASAAVAPAAPAQPSHAVELRLLASELAHLEQDAHGAERARAELEAEAEHAGSQLRAKQRTARREREQTLTLAKQMTALEVALVEAREHGAHGHERAASDRQDAAAAAEERTASAFNGVIGELQLENVQLRQQLARSLRARSE
jgi:chromosome segregation ATPase